MKALYFKELRSFLGSMIGYIFIIIFLITSGIFHWVVSSDTNLLNSQEVDLIPFFNLSPIIFLILIPAITMRTIAEERKSGTIELLFTRPITDLQLLLSKYFASITLLLIALLPTLIYYFSMASLGVETTNDVGELVTNIDEGRMITSYIGLFLLGSVFTAIGVFASSITSNQIIAFIIAMFSCWFFYQGLELIGSFDLIGNVDYVFQFLSLDFHYRSIMRGIIDSSDVIYFLGAIVLFLALAMFFVKSLKK
jgi:ABC-2 type transport system permease protein